MPLSFTRRQSMLLSGAALALGLPSAACAQAIPIRIGYVPVIGASALFVLDGAGWAKEAGLDIRLSRFDSGPAAIQALGSGTLDALAIGIAPVAVARSKGLDVKVVSAAGTGGSAFVASAALAANFSAANGDQQKAFGAFRAATGRRAKLATLPPGGVPTVALSHWLFKLAKVDPADVEIVQMGIDAVQQAMLAGTADGGTVLEPSATIVIARKPELKRIATAQQMFADITGVVLAATGAFEKAQPEAVQKLVTLMARATDLIITSPKDAAPYVVKTLGAGLVDEATMTAALASPAVGYLSDPRAIVAPTQAMLAYQVELGDFPSAPSTAGLFDSSYWERAAAGK